MIKIFYLPINKGRDHIKEWAATSNKTVHRVMLREAAEFSDSCLFEVHYKNGGNPDKVQTSGILMEVGKGGSLNKRRSMI